MLLKDKAFRTCHTPCLTQQKSCTRASSCFFNKRSIARWCCLPFHDVSRLNWSSSKRELSDKRWRVLWKDERDYVPGRGIDKFQTTYVSVRGNCERKPNRSARASTIRYRSNVHVPKKGATLLVRSPLLSSFFFLSFAFFCTSCHQLSALHAMSAFFFPFFQLICATVHG